MTLSICLATWNSEKYLPELMKSIFKQSVLTREDYDIKISIDVVDSGSVDNSVAFLQKEYPEVHILRNTQNLGFAKSYNQAIRMSATDYVLVLNADIVLEPDYLEKLLTVMEKDRNIGSAAGKLLRAHSGESYGQGFFEIEKTKIIDSCGLEMKRNRRFLNIGESEEDRGQYDKNLNPFGFCAAAVLYRRTALEKIKYGHEYFDEDFFSYKEDIDLSWRLKQTGFQAIFVPEATAYHFRGTPTTTKKYTNLSVAKFYKKKNRLIRRLSYRNHLLCLIKNENTRDFWRNFFPIFWYEFRKLVYLIFFDWPTLKGFFQALKLIPKMRAKRKLIRK
ncbi:MAG: glycosyltransferase family 2 protein [Patescibacteria group bacterium]|nr:glycosyltransferase family 2 protein [Patescibacteria group bacterium]